ncbi:MAG: hypothetical protein RLZZ628_244 [Bacteroidota bacterium]
MDWVIVVCIGLYDPLKIHALNQVTGFSNISTNNQDVVYTKFQRPEKITENGNELTYTYAADYERRKAVLKTNGATVYTRLYFGDYEITTRNGVNQYVHYIAGGDGICAIAVKEGNSAFNFYVPYTDHLGSILTVTNTSGTVVAEQNFDAWGRKRNPTNWGYANFPTNPTWLYRGYTGHEHLPEFYLINMNARLYDPVLGRMLSPDNYVSVGGSQGLNRYTYANNNPLKYTDPSGNFIPAMIVGAMIGAAIDISIQVSSKGWRHVNVTQVGIAALSGAVGGGVGALVGGSAALATSSLVVQGAVSGAAAGAASGLTSGLMNGQTGWDLAKTTIIGAGVGAAMGAGTAYIKGRFFPSKTKAGTPAISEPTNGARGGSIEVGTMTSEFPAIDKSFVEGGSYDPYYDTPHAGIPMTPTGEKLALGLREDLSRFTDWLGGINYKNLSTTNVTPHNIFKAMENPNNTLHYNLTDFKFDKYQSYINSPQLNIDAPTANNYSNWELFHIYNNKWLNRVTFYEYVKPQNIFGKGTYRIVQPPF